MGIIQIRSRMGVKRYDPEWRKKLIMNWEQRNYDHEWGKIQIRSRMGEKQNLIMSWEQRNYHHEWG